MRSNLARPLILTSFFGLATILGFLVPLLYWGKTIRWDWDYFNSLSLLVKSMVLYYGVFPNHDPWVCGGQDILANPQNRVFSPFFLFDLIFSPQNANLFSLMTYGFFGMWGMYTVLRSLRVSKWIAVVGATLFINSSWFGLHYSTGHIVYGSMQLLPWIMYFFLRLNFVSSHFVLSSLLALFILDGGMYTFIFSCLLMLGLSCAGLAKPWSQLLGFKKRQWIEVGLCWISAFLLISARMIPVLQAFSKRKPELEITEIPGSEFLSIFFNPLQSPESASRFYIFRFHEYGCYLGLVAFGLVAWNANRPNFLNRNLKWMCLMLFWLWIASGLGRIWNPWTLFQHLPLFNNAHVQSRVFILMYLCFVILLCKSLNRIPKSHWSFGFILGVLLTESLFVKNYPFLRQFQEYPQDGFNGKLIRSDTIFRTTFYADIPGHYLKGFQSSLYCYDPASQETNVTPFTSPSYKGEIFSLDRDSTITLSRHTPGQVSFFYSAKGPTTIQVNSNYLSGWKVTYGDGVAYREALGRIQVQTRKKSGSITIQYRPKYIPYIFYLYFSGLILWIALCYFQVRLFLSKDRRKFG